MHLLVQCKKKKKKKKKTKTKTINNKLFQDNIASVLFFFRVTLQSNSTENQKYCMSNEDVLEIVVFHLLSFNFEDYDK